jgi:hypothetical protein
MNPGQPENAHIRILSVPAGEAPLHVRAEWVGLVLPLAPGRPKLVKAHGVGVCSGKPIEGTLIRYVVLVEDAIARLEEKAPEAAAWWRRNVPRLFGKGCTLLFDDSACEYLPAGEDLEFLSVGSLQVFEAQRLLPKLEGASIRFQIETEDRASRKINPTDIAYSGPSGARFTVRVFVHRDDVEHARAILAEVFKV